MDYLLVLVYDNFNYYYTSAFTGILYHPSFHLYNNWNLNGYDAGNMHQLLFFCEHGFICEAVEDYKKMRSYDFLFEELI